MKQIVTGDIQRKSDLFLSHSSKDKEFVVKLAEDLNILQIDVWLDSWEISVGDSLFDKLATGLSSSKYICLVISNAFNESKWASNELKQAFAREMREERKVILPIVIEKTIIPSFIEDKIYIDFTSDYFSSLSMLSGVIHGLNTRAIDEGVRMNRPENINGCIEVLRYSGFEPYIMVDKEIFEEILTLGGASYKDGKLRLNPEMILRMPDVSERTKEYLYRAIRAWR